VNSPLLKRTTTLSIAAALAVFSAGYVTPPQISAAMCVRPSAPARTVRAVAPALPADPSAMKHGTNGAVLVAVGIDASGNPHGAQIRSSTNPSLNAAAIHAALASKYAPALSDCRPVASTYLFTVAYGTTAP